MAYPPQGADSEQRTEETPVRIFWKTRRARRKRFPLGSAADRRKMTAGQKVVISTPSELRRTPPNDDLARGSEPFLSRRPFANEDEATAEKASPDGAPGGPVSRRWPGEALCLFTSPKYKGRRPPDRGLSAFSNREPAGGRSDNHLRRSCMTLTETIALNTMAFVTSSTSRRTFWPSRAPVAEGWSRSFAPAHRIDHDHRIRSRCPEDLRYASKGSPREHSLTPITKDGGR